MKEGRLTLPKDNAFDVQVRLADGSTLERKGKINFSDTRINPSTGTFEMRAEVTNADRLLKPGQFVRVRLQGAVRNNALAVPQVAVMDGAQGKFVYVVDKDKDGKDIAAVRPVTLGEWVAQDGVEPVGGRDRAEARRPGDRRRRRQAASRRADQARRRPAAPAAARPAPLPAKDAKSAPKADPTCFHASSSTGRSSRP